ncbi:hypothetical protein B0H11DRAFT_1989974 [Mycena galericulata]|nr:hypothetical protein B0H11DRAFT_1989974 [Mycena galericulata]
MSKRGYYVCYDLVNLNYLSLYKESMTYTELLLMTTDFDIDPERPGLRDASMAKNIEYGLMKGTFRDGHGYGLGYKSANPDPNPKNPNPNPRVYGLLTGRRATRAGSDPCAGISQNHVFGTKFNVPTKFCSSSASIWYRMHSILLTMQLDA